MYPVDTHVPLRPSAVDKAGRTRLPGLGTSTVPRSYRLQATDYRPQATGHRLQATGYRQRAGLLARAAAADQWTGLTRPFFLRTPSLTQPPITHLRSSRILRHVFYLSETHSLKRLTQRFVADNRQPTLGVALRYRHLQEQPNPFVILSSRVALRLCSLIHGSPSSSGYAGADLYRPTYPTYLP